VTKWLHVNQPEMVMSRH